MNKFLLLLYILIVGCASGSNQSTLEQRVKSQSITEAKTKEARKKIDKFLDQKKIELSQKEQEEVISLVQKAKETCEMFGYEIKTEKFADCAKEIYSKETEIKSSSNSKTIIVNNENSGAQVLADELKRQRRQQAFDELIGVSQGLLSGKSLTESLGVKSSSNSKSSSSNLKSTCYNTGEETGGLNKSCRYSCSGSLVTTVISAHEICPVHIKR